MQSEIRIEILKGFVKFKKFPNTKVTKNKSK